MTLEADGRSIDTLSRSATQGGGATSHADRHQVEVQGEKRNMSSHSKSHIRSICGCWRGRCDYLWKIKRPDYGPGAMETAEDEWWKRMERAETIAYSVLASA
ncbi:hypothetical protein CDAR_415831 [Caerostris darwini]|uniref:Uncharacterized protein n=1 Tax=Caerostris darwini TaxID=1538125 RepID=A0AAV4RPS0_9ARAC|nr:hypothetical protein CDAR_415831 [Caerostris darwini]